MRTLAFLCILLAACAAEEPAATTTTTTTTSAPAAPAPPSADQAKEMIAASPDFGDFEFTHAAFSLPVAGSAMNEPARTAARTLASKGWLAFDGAGDIMLTPKSREDKRFLLRPNGILDIVPLAKKQMGDVVAVRSNPDNTAEADFTWTWVPNEIGAAAFADRYAGTRNARAVFIHDGTSWSVLKIEGR